MSVKVSSWVWHEATDEVNGNELILLLALADVADDFGRCRFVDEESALTYDSLARKVRVDRRTIERLIPKLRGRGLIEQVRGARGRPNEFRVVVPWAVKSTDKVSDIAADSPTSGTDSPTAVHGFPDNGGDRSSINVLNVRDVESVRATRGTRIAEPFIVTAEMRQWAAAETPLVDVDRATRMFVDYWRAETGSKATKRDWLATWRNWLRRDQERAETRPGAKLSPSDRALATIALGQEQKAVGA